MGKLYWSATLVVLAHAAVVFWHLELLAGLGSALTPAQVPLFASLANLIPVVAVILLWAHFPKIGSWLLLFLALPLPTGTFVEYKRLASLSHAFG
jgi:hypothetical protein